MVRPHHGAVLLSALLLPLLLLSALLPPGQAQADMAPSGCHMLDCESRVGGYYTDWNLWDTGLNKTMALGDYTGWEFRVVSWNAARRVYVLYGTSGGGVAYSSISPVTTDGWHTLTSEFVLGVALKASDYSCFVVEFCSPGLAGATPTFTPTDVAPIIVTATPITRSVILTPVPLQLSEVVSTSHALTVQQVAAWQPGAETFDMFAGTAFFVTVFGVLAVMVSMARRRWRGDHIE
jgi:hypothetical protein